MISLLAFVLGAATFYEARYGTDAVQVMVYESPWFALLLGVLALNIFAAAVIRIPWKRHQTGFVITHTGLLVLLFGCVYGIRHRVDGVMAIMPGEAVSEVRLKREHLMFTLVGSQGHARVRVPVDMLSQGAYPSLAQYLASAWWREPGKPRWPEGRMVSVRTPEELNRAAGVPVIVELLEWMPSSRPLTGFVVGSDGDAPAAHVVIEGRLPNEPDSAASRVIADTWLSVGRAEQRVGALLLRLVTLEDARAVEAFTAYDADMELPAGVMGMIEIAGLQDGRWLARRVTRRGVESAEELKAGVSSRAFMSLTWRAVELLPHARAREGYEPLDLTPDKAGIPAARLRITAGEVVRELWIARDGRPRMIGSTGENTGIAVAYSVDHLPLGFAVKLDRFERGIDPGTNNPASFASHVRILDAQTPMSDEAHRIWMNNPLRYGGLVFYQSGFQELPDGGTMTILAVGRDPGRPIKYAGSALIVMGIFTMFYMRAYFFRRAPASSTFNSPTDKTLPATSCASGGTRTPAAGAAVVTLLLLLGGYGHAVADVSPPDKQHLTLETVPRFSPRTLDQLRAIPVMHEGRIKPLDTVARQVVRQVTGKSTFGVAVLEGGEVRVVHRLDPVEMLISLMSDPTYWSEQPVIQVELLELRAFLGLPATQTHIAAHQLNHHAAFRETARGLMAKTSEAEREGVSFTPTRLESAILDVARREGHLRAACRGGMLGQLPVPHDDAMLVWIESQAASDASLPVARMAVAQWGMIPKDLPHDQRRRMFMDHVGWLTLDGLFATDPTALPAPVAPLWNHIGSLWAKLLTDYVSADDATLDASARDLAGSLPVLIAPSEPILVGVRREVFYNHFHPFRWAMMGYLLAAMGFLLSTQIRHAAAYASAAVLLITAIGANVYGFALRILITGWAPVTNMYETIVWVALVCAVLGVVFELIYRRRVIGVAAGVVAGLCALVADIIPPSLGAELKNLQPVLRSNFWLWTHVTTIVSSYAAFALALGMGNVALGFYLVAPGRREVLQRLTLFIYRAIQVGVLLVAAGTILGGIWADQSWGRFWGWDPKEVWALIVLLVYLAILHGRYAGWVGPFGLAAGAVMGFMSVIMAWYGVNFVLGVGLHSYGFGAGGRAEVFTGVAIQTAFVLLAAFVHRRRMYGGHSQASSVASPAASVSPEVQV